MAKKMFLGISTHLGGAEHSLIDFLKTYKNDPEAHDFFVVLPKSDGPLIEALKTHQIRYIVLPLPKNLLNISRSRKLSYLFLLPALIAFAPYLMKLKSLIAQENVDTVHSTGIKCHILLCLLAPFINCRIIIHIRDIIPVWLGCFFNIFSNFEKISWLASSKAISQSLPQILPTPLYDGVNEKIFFPQRQDLIKNQLSISPNSKLIGLVGVVAKWKGQKEFLLAAHSVLKKYPDTHFAIIGDQIYDTSGDRNYLNHLKELCKNLKIDTHFHFLPFHKQPEVVFNSLDWAVHASIKPEPFGRVAVEAMLCKTPIIASRAGGILEIVQENRTGLLHNPGDIKDLEKVICFALNLPDHERQKMIESAYDYCTRTFMLSDRYAGLKKIINNTI